MKILFLNIATFLFAINLFGQKAHIPLEITHLTGDFYVFTTYQTYKGSLVPANSMYLVTDEGVALFDTPWDITQVQPLLDSIKIKHNKTVKMCIATHSHEDRTGGFDVLHAQGVKTFTTCQTDAICKEKGQKRAEFLIEHDTVFKLGQYEFQTYYPGQGHTPDNIVVWFERDKVLYGGCLIKSVEATTLGNLADANVKEWPNTIKNIQQKFKKTKFIIPGHDDWNSLKSLSHTLKLLKKHLKTGK